ncbi:MAG: alpha/beta hydrolase, partial [Clostridium sp.]|nr:alpha/beta hydrolase [Clostridium sp.]
MTGFFQFISNLIPSYLHKILCPLLAILCALLGLTVRDPHIEQPQQPETTTAIVETTTAPSTTVPATTEPTTTEVATTEPTTVPTTEVTTTEEPTTTEPPTTLAPLPTMQTRYSDMSYGEKSAQKMDVYLPEDINERREPYDVMIFLHGGFWCSGDKSSYSGFCATYAAQGYACVTMNYQLLSQYAFIGTDNGVRCQNMLDDMTAAITAIKNLLESNGRQVDKLALRGYSAGGHLSATYAYTCADISPIPIAFCVL